MRSDKFDCFFSYAHVDRNDDSLIDGNRELWIEKTVEQISRRLEKNLIKVELENPFMLTSDDSDLAQNKGSTDIIPFFSEKTNFILDNLKNCEIVIFIFFYHSGEGEEKSIHNYLSVISKPTIDFGTSTSTFSFTYKISSQGKHDRFVPLHCISHETLQAEDDDFIDHKSVPIELIIKKSIGGETGYNFTPTENNIALESFKENLELSCIKDTVSDVLRNKLNIEKNAVQTFTRYPDLNLPAQTQLKQIILLRIAVTCEPKTPELAEHAMDLSVPPNVDSIELDVLITADGFDILGNNYKPLTVPIKRDSDPIIFQLRAKATGVQNVKAEFFQHGRYVGGLTVSTTVVEQAQEITPEQAQTNKQSIIRMDSSAMPTDCTLLITQNRPEEHQYTYSFTVHAPKAGLYFYTIPEKLLIDDAPSRYVDNLFRELEDLYQREQYDDIPDTLEAIGADLYERLFPQELKTLWKNRIRDQVKSIQIVSDEPWIPWELIKPAYENPDGDFIEDGFLCEDYLMGRWLSGAASLPPPPANFHLDKGTFIIPPDSGLYQAQREADLLAELGYAVEATEPTLSGVRSMLQKGDYRLIHFACHAEFDNEEHEQAVIKLQDGGKLKSRDISGKNRSFGKHHPLIFVNACQSARSDFKLAGLGGWADKFISAKTSAFVGSAWSVGDDGAYRFAEVFYQALKDGEPLGEAMRQARAATKQLPETTWLAYVLYGDPLAKMDMQQNTP